MNQIKLYLSTILCVVVSSTYAIDEPNHDMTRLLQSRLGSTEVPKVTATPVEGIYQTRFGAKIAYLLGNGRYVFIGDMIDLQSQINLTEVSRRELMKQAIDAFPKDDLVIFPATSDTKAVLNIFTDTSCPYCKKLHEEVPQLQKAGIEVRYFPFPRGGSRGPGYKTLQQVWCGEDRAKTMDIAKGVKSGALPDGNCETAGAVDKGYKLGNTMGITGTPALFTQSGRKYDGYVPYKKLIPMVLGSGS